MVRTILMLLLIATVVASVGYQVGAYHARQTFEPQVVTEYVPLPPEIIEVEVVKEVPVEVEVIKEVPIKLREFESLRELKDWLANDDLDSHLVLRATRDGYIDLRGPCDHLALELQRRAIEQGYLMSTQILKLGSGLHMMNSTVIGNDIYFIEPLTDRVWLDGHRH